jgi:anti-anti-sigma factor
VSGSPGNAPGAGHLHARVCRGADRVTLVVSGDLDRLTGPGLIGLAREIIEERVVSRVDVDLGGVEFLDLGGLRALMRVHEYGTRDGIAVTVRNPRHYVRWLLEVTGAAEILSAEHRARTPRAESALSWVDRHLTQGSPSASYVRLIRERAVQADDRDRLADEREKMLDERQQRLTDQQHWEDLREDLADQRERDLEKRERDT